MADTVHSTDQQVPSLLTESNEMQEPLLQNHDNRSISSIINSVNEITIQNDTQCDCDNKNIIKNDNGIENQSKNANNLFNTQTVNNTNDVNDEKAIIDPNNTINSMNSNDTNNNDNSNDNDKKIDLNSSNKVNPSMIGIDRKQKEIIAKMRMRDKASKVNKIDLDSIRWKGLKVKRGTRNGVFPVWARQRNKVYKSELSQFGNQFLMSIQRMFTNKPVPPVAVERGSSTTTVLPLRPPNNHTH